MLLRELFYKELNEATLRRGSRGEDVKALQRSLGIRPADGIFGPQTERAVRNFQTAARITVDGIAGGQTQAAIRRFQEVPGASSDYGQIRPGTDWSELDPGEIQVTPQTAAPAAPAQQTPAAARGLQAADPAADAQADDAARQPADTRSAAAQAADPDGDGNADDPEAQVFAGEPQREPTGSGRGDGESEVAARREEAARQATDEFVKAQVAELTRIRRNMPNDQLIRTITQRAVEQGLNDDWRENGAMAAFIAELVPTIDRSAAPEVDTTAPAQPQAATTGSETPTTGTAADNARTTTTAPTMTQPGADAAPRVDTTAAAAQQISRFQQVYGNGSDGQLPTLFRDRFLNPALDNLESRTMQALSDELAGEIPQAPARVIVQRLEQVYGNEQELQQAAQEMRGDTDPDIQDQVRALELLIPLLTKLKRDAARNESVELDRLMMLAGV